MSGIEDSGRYRSTIDFGWHKVGGKHPDGTPIAIGPWTFEAPQVRRVVESYLTGRVLNACAGKTRLDHDDVHRNDVDPDREADTHHDVRELDQYLPPESFDVVVFDPPWDKEQAEEHYHGHHVGKGGAGGMLPARTAIANLTAPGGRVLSFGWNSFGLESFVGWEREAVHLFQRGPGMPEAILVVDRNIQTRLGGNTRAKHTGSQQSGGGA